jgi:hypothetical protein
MAAAGLEARYRRLLGWFPADHRAVHGEEMLGVLMTGADDDRDKPGLRETADLLLGAARIRLRPGRALSDRDGWRDALAIFSVAGPVLILATVCLVYLVQLVTSLLQVRPANWGAFGFGAPSLGWSGLGTYYGQASAIPWLVLSGQGLVVLLVLLGRRRSAAEATVLYLAAIIYVQRPYPGLGILTGPLLLRELFLLVLPVAQIVALLASPGPRRGRELLRGRHWALLAVAAVAAAALTAAFLPAIVAARPPVRVLAWLPGYGLAWGPGGGLAFARMDPFPITKAAAAVVVILLLAAWLSSPMGKRLAVLFAVIAYPVLEAVLLHYINYRWPSAGYWGYEGLPTLPAVLERLVVCAPAVIIYGARRRARSFGSGSDEGLA